MDLGQILTTVSVAAIPAVFAITVHEVAHDWVAGYFGDHTAESLGRLSFNPIRHIDPVGTVVVPALLLLSQSGFLFVWAKPVPVDPRNLRKPRTNMLPIPPLDGGQVLTNLLPAGPISEFLRRFAPLGFIVVLALIVSKQLWPLIGPPFVFLLSLLQTIFGLRLI